MKQMIFREVNYVGSTGAKIRRREYLKQYAGGWSWAKKYNHFKFNNHIEALDVLKRLKTKDGYRNGIEPVDELHYAIIS